MQPQQISKASVQPEVAPVSPSLVPALPEPMQADTTTIANHDELAFFDRVKKYVGNKNTMNEFLKLCNLFSQDLIDKNALVQRVQNFIGGNPDLIGWFKQFVGYDGKDQVIENKAKTFQGRVSLNNCRSYGPSYRLLPKRVSAED
jgi:paired amphipathic helix protein Sin3a